MRSPKVTEPVEILRAYRVTLDPNPTQELTLAQHAGAARWAFNHALAVKMAAREQWKGAVAALVAAGASEEDARRQVRVPTPTKPAIQKALNKIKGDDRQGVAGVCPWWHVVSTYAFQSAFLDADMAWKAWLDSLAGRRKGRRVGYPRFKKKGRSRDSFRLHHDVKRPTIRPVTTRRLLLPRIGEVRTHDSLKRLMRALDRRSGVIQSVTVSRGAHRWYASVLVREWIALPAPNRAQRTAGTVGIDLGARSPVTLSTGERFFTQRAKARHARALAKASRAVARTLKGSRRRGKAQRRLARLQHLEAARRSTDMHRLTKRLATGWAMVAVPDLQTAGMTHPARGTGSKAGAGRRPRRGLNRVLRDVSPSEVRRQLDYKTVWYGSRISIVDHGYPSNKTCSACGTAKTTLALSERVFHCTACGLSMDRDVNTARAIARFAVASDRGETENARGAPVRPIRPVRTVTRGTSMREGPPTGGSPQCSDAQASPRTITQTGEGSAHRQQG